MFSFFSWAAEDNFKKLKQNEVINPFTIWSKKLSFRVSEIFWWKTSREVEHDWRRNAASMILSKLANEKFDIETTKTNQQQLLYYTDTAIKKSWHWSAF